MKVLVLNCGSSSLKFQLFNMDQEDVLAGVRAHDREVGRNGGLPRASLDTAADYYHVDIPVILVLYQSNITVIIIPISQ